MVCASCGAENRPGRKFCLSCGRALAVACPACGAPNEPEARYCGECAAALAQGGTSAVTPASPAEARPDRAAPPGAGAERRLVTVLFADLVGFTPLAEQRDAEDVRELLTRFFALASEVIGRYRGAVEKFIGDAVMAVWGAPVAREDDAERAVRAALDLVEGVRHLEPGLTARAGVLTGEAAVTLGAAGQGMVAGDLVNTASRLQAAAPAGVVLVGDATHRASSAGIAFEPAGDQVLKGKTAPVPAWRALRVVAEVGGRRRANVLEAPFVGRGDELRLLKDLFHATSREQRPRLVSITGQAGIGKSRLAWELLKYIDGLAEEVWWHEGRCPAYGDGVTFWALGEMVRRRAGLAETDDERTTRARIAATAKEHVRDESERRWVEHALLVLLGLEPPPPGGPQELFAAWRTFFERLAASGPVCLAFEDLQWADTGLLDFIDHLLEWSRGVAIYVLALARPELRDRRPDWGLGKRSFVGLALEPLSSEAMRELVAGLVPGLPDAAIRSIVERSGGVPLYAVETVRMLQESGQLVVDGAAYRPVGELGTVAVPETLQALITSRLDALDPRARSILLDAAVLGQGLTVPALAAVSGIGTPELEPHLRTLVQRELLAIEADPRSPGHGQHTFVQALVREVAYSTLARSERRRRHLAAARYLEATGDEELAGALAVHYLSAYQASQAGPEADTLAAQARVTLKGAAARAAALGSHEQALAFLEQALEITADPAEQAGLLDRAAYCASHAGHHDQGEALCRRAIDAYLAIGDRASAARAVAALVDALVFAFRIGAAQDVLEAAVHDYADLGDETPGIVLSSQLARICVLNGQVQRGLELADRVLDAAERMDLVPTIADALLTKGTALSFFGRAYEGIGALEAGRKLAESRGLMDTARRAYTNLGVTQINRDPRAAFEVTRTGLEMSRRFGDRSSLLFELSNAAEEALVLGEWDWALAELAEALSGDVEAPNRLILVSEQIPFRAFRGEPVAADLAHVEASMIDAGMGYPDLDAELGYIRAQAALADGRLRDAAIGALRSSAPDPINGPRNASLAARAALWDRDVDTAREALARFDESGTHGMSSDLSRATIAAGIAALEGDRAGSLAAYRTALRGWGELDVPWEQALTAIDAVELLGPGEPDLLAAAEEARAILDRLGAKPMLARLDTALARPNVGALLRS